MPLYVVNNYVVSVSQVKSDLSSWKQRLGCLRGQVLCGKCSLYQCYVCGIVPLVNAYCLHSRS